MLFCRTVPFLGALLSCAALANDLSFSPAALAKESSAPLSLNFTSSPEPVVGFQFDLEYDPSAIQLTAAVGEAVRLAGKNLYVSTISPSRTRFLIAGWNQNAILDGPLIRFLVGTTLNAEPRDYPVTFSDLVAAYPSGLTAPVSSATGIITVVPGSPLRLVPEGVVNAATFAAGLVVPGEVVTLVGQGIGPRLAEMPESGVSSPVLGGTSVWFDGVQAPLLYAGPNQINLVVPFSVATGSVNGEAQIAVRNGGLITASVNIPVGTASPGLFTAASSGVGPGAILNQDGSPNSDDHPAEGGQVISLFATGGGAMDPPGADGAIATGTSQRTLLPVSVKIGGVEAEVLYAGSAPGLLMGVLQINCKIPATVPPGDAVEVLVTVGAVTSPAGTTFSIR